VADVLTERQIQVFKHLTLGRSYPRIGRAPHIAPETAPTHTISIRRKLHVNSKRELVGPSLSTRLGTPV
jgi:DNA-binding NarL/FixJ family response regulator